MRLELAHLKPTGLRGRSRGSERQLKDVLANPTCYARLCRACHVEMDAGQLEDVRERLIRKREADLKHIRRLCTILQFARRDLPLALIPDPTGANILFRRIC